MLSYKPLGRRVVVKRKKKDVGGLILGPELEREGHPDIGIIIAVGNLKFMDKLRGIGIGKTIYYTQYSPIKVQDGEEEEEDHYFVEVGSILGISNI